MNHELRFVGTLVMDDAIWTIFARAGRSSLLAVGSILLLDASWYSRCHFVFLLGHKLDYLLDISFHSITTFVNCPDKNAFQRLFGEMEIESTVKVVD